MSTRRHFLHAFGGAIPLAVSFSKLGLLRSMFQPAADPVGVWVRFQPGQSFIWGGCQVIIDADLKGPAESMEVLRQPGVSLTEELREKLRAALDDDEPTEAQRLCLEALDELLDD